MAKAKYKTGQMYKHNKHDLIIRLLERERFGRFIFEIVAGELPNTMFPDTVWDTSLTSYFVYSTDTIRKSFNLISGVGAEVLYGVKKDGD